MADDETTQEEGASGDAAQADEPIGKTTIKNEFGVLIFDKWDPDGVVVSDPGLARYMNLGAQLVLHSGARHANRWFGKSRVNIVERFVNQLMRTEKYTGKKTKALGAVEDAFNLIHDRTQQNPLQVLVDAITHAAPREEVTRLRYGGISVPKAVDTAPSRRVDWALRHLALGALSASYKNPKPISQCIADELLKAAKGQPESYAVGKKDEIERVAGSAR